MKIRMLDHENKLRDLKMAAEICASAAGDVAEVGVYMGGSLACLASSFFDRTVYGIDTFNGMPEESENDNYHCVGDFSDADYKSVKAVFDKLFPNVVLVKGMFPYDVVDKIGNKYSMVHVDCDIYQSVKDCCEFFWPLVSNGGVMVFDDPGFDTCLGARKAVDEYRFDNGEFLQKDDGRSWIVIKGL